MSMQVHCIWQQARHNAFTDLIAFHHTLWCVFREGSAHISPAGQFRILRSLDGEHWLSTAFIRLPDADLRDAKFSILPDGRLMACVRLYDEHVRTSLCWIDRKNGQLTEWQTLPSGGDCSYAAMVLKDNKLYVSYYSSHEGFIWLL